ncbi:uncharacterized protein LOC124415441 [Diprion similis]|uniref:uncharacterized protein LOC124415441 n=1 Tax=Diprion similis TaxID=362088 RepID=UPI001EF7F02B|nr:uncharacterized protein LOC124415441 [Diprion similis]
MHSEADSTVEVKMEIQNELSTINTVVLKIKQELHEINDIVQSNGLLDTTLKNALGSLTILAQEAGVSVEEMTNTGEQNPLTNALSRISTGYITEKLKSLSH